MKVKDEVTQEIKPKTKVRELDPNYVLPETIDTYLLWLYEKWGFDAARLMQDDKTGVTKGLRNVVKCHLEAVTDPIERSKAFSFVISDPLPEARVPAAVFMSRFKDLYLAYPHLKPSRATPPKQKPNPEAQALVADTVALVKKDLAATPDSYGSSRDTRTPGRRVGSSARPQRGSPSACSGPGTLAKYRPLACHPCPSSAQTGRTTRPSRPLPCTIGHHRHVARPRWQSARRTGTYRSSAELLGRA